MEGHALHKGALSPPAGGVPRGEAQRSGFAAIRKNGEMDVKLPASAESGTECARSDANPSVSLAADSSLYTREPKREKP